MSTAGYGGKTLNKKLTVNTNDPNNAQIPVTIKGQVIKIYTLDPKSVKLKGVVGETIRETIRMVVNEGHAFKIQEITAKRGENIRFQYEEIDGGNDIVYELTVENTATKPGVYFDTLYLKTNSQKKPEIDISVVGSIREAADPAVKKENS